MISIRHLNLLYQRSDLSTIPQGKCLINTINAHSYNTARRDDLFADSLLKCDYLLPDGISIVQACNFLRHTTSKPKERTTGWDLFSYEMTTLNKLGSARKKGSNNGTYQKPVAFFMGSSPKVLDLIIKKAATVYPYVEIKTYSPPYKQEFTVEENQAIVDAINAANPDVLWIGMTAPKQEKWVYSHWNELNIHCHCGSIGAVFDFFAGTVKRAPFYWQKFGLEWLYRLLREPRRMWRRYIIGNSKFIYIVLKEKFFTNA